MKNLLLFITFISTFALGQGPLGSATNPLTSFNGINVLPTGYYHFNIGGHLFNTKVENGYVLVAQDYYTDSLPVPNGLSQVSSIITASDRALLDSVIIKNFPAFDAIRITGPTIECTTLSTQALNNLRNFKPLLLGGSVATSATTWTNTGDSVTYFSGSCPGGLKHPNLAKVIAHSCGNVWGIHWMPYLPHKRERHNLGEVTQGSDSSALRLWVKDNTPPPNTPVELTYFASNCDEEGASIVWETASEHNSKSFIVEQSDNGEDWYETATITAAGHSTELKPYQLSVSNKAKYFKLIQEDRDGGTKTYGPISLNCDEEGKFKLEAFPNPTKEYLIVAIANEEVNTTYTAILTNTFGVEVYRQDILVETGTTVFRTETLQPGMYTLNVANKQTLIIKL